MRARSQESRWDFNTRDFGNGAVWKYHSIYKIRLFLRRHIKGPDKSPELDFIEPLRELLDLDLKEPLIADTFERFIFFHRIVENTKARKRLEFWAKRVIVVYLLVVCAMVITNSIIPLKAYFNIDEKIVIALLTTTTINIIGLGLIVLRGHFFVKDESAPESKVKSQYNNPSESLAKEAVEETAANEN